MIAPSYETTKITRSKRLTYDLFKGIIPTPTVYRNADEINHYPIFIKPAIGQGSVGTLRVNDRTHLLSLDIFNVNSMTRGGGGFAITF